MSAPESMPHVLPAWMYPLLIALALYGLWRVERRIWPWTTCMSCKGSGRWREPGVRAWRDCGVCGGSGRRRRGRLR
jgi:hypothetical protein